jgi:uncharacterized membrane protein
MGIDYCAKIYHGIHKQSLIKHIISTKTQQYIKHKIIKLLETWLIKVLMKVTTNLVCLVLLPGLVK